MRAYLKSPMFIALAFVAACWSIMIHEVVDFAYWNAHFKRINFGNSSPPSDIAIVSLDGGRGDESGALAGTSQQASLLRRILAEKPRHVYFDSPQSGGMDVAGDRDFIRAVAEGGKRVTVVLRANHDLASEQLTMPPPLISYPPSIEIAVSKWEMNFYGYAVKGLPTVQAGDRIYPALAVLEGKGRSLERPVYPDFSINPQANPTDDAIAIMSGKTADSLHGKTVFVTSTAPRVGSILGYVGHGRVPMVDLDIAGVQSARKGPPIMMGSLLYLLAFMLMASLGQRTRSRLLKVVIYGGAVFLMLAAPALLYNFRIIGSSSLGLLAMVGYVPARLWQKWRRRVQLTNDRSGLPNIEALVTDGIPGGCEVLAATVERYDEILASLPRALHGECTRQIARRLSLAAGDRVIFANDKGQFVWLEEPRPTESMVHHLEGLKALFSAPLVIGEHLLDTNIHFGLDRLAANPPDVRVQAALASSGEALSKGKLYEEFEHQRMAAAPWELSLHARIDEGLRNGDIWLAFQGQMNLLTRKIDGAEALIRWSDPERGEIPPDAFILQAERAGRIEAITYWVIERAIEGIKILSREFSDFGVSVNLSARMADHPALLDNIARIARNHDFDCSRMTIEVTETFSMANREMARINLHGLREMGFKLSIDDFGSGQASLAYLAEIPCDEIKLDKRFVQAITSNRRERLIVRTVIRLAHALGQSVVAEGIEDEATLRALHQMNCDTAQGYHIARPMRLDDLCELIRSRSHPQAA